MKNRALDHSDNWGTPPYIFGPLNAEFNFDFDPCPLSSPGTITPETDGLLIKWGLRNFVNPPYSRKLKEAFIKKAVVEAHRGALCVMLLPVSTSTAIYHDVIKPNKKEIRFIRGRVKFCGFNKDGFTSKGRGMHDSMVVIFDGRK